MPAKKPVSLNKRHDTKAVRKKREAGEAALTPKFPLMLRAPAKLTGAVARTTWKETVALYLGLDARIVSVLDRGLLMDFCVISGQLAEIDDLRAKARRNYFKAQIRLDRIRESKKHPVLDPKQLQLLINAVNWQMDLILKLDSRADRKRALLHTMRQSLYLTPRSRAMMVPERKTPEPLKSDMEKLLDGGS
jgi:hypothetical protein